MALRRNTWLWILWITASIALIGWFLLTIFLSGDRSMMLIGETTGTHHQFEVSCETCHTADPFETPKKVFKALNKTCVTCHKDELAASNDSHPGKKFRSPRMARFWDKVDVRQCTSCHVEHQPEITRPGAVTLAMDFCVACHSEGDQDVRANRPSHEGLGFDTCASAGCHNFHDNRALYEDFLVKHADDPWLAETPIHKFSAQARARKRGDGSAVLEESDAPQQHQDTQAHLDWASSAHAAADVGCAGCHAPKAKTPEEISANWVETPDMLSACATCHRDQKKTYASGRHGMRAHPKIAKPRDVKKQLKRLGWKKPDEELIAMLEAVLDDAEPPKVMTVAEARIPMKPEAHDAHLDCGSCHQPHKQDVSFAAVDACVSCHDDEHTNAYFESPHHELWRAEMAGEGPPGSGVSCATCHMPKVKKRDSFYTTHNQNEFLRPNEKMIRPVCMDCHGLSFAIDALADPSLVLRNFNGVPEVHIESIDWAIRRIETDESGANQ